MTLIRGTNGLNLLGTITDRALTLMHRHGLYLFVRFIQQLNDLMVKSHCWAHFNSNPAMIPKLVIVKHVHALAKLKLLFSIPREKNCEYGPPRAHLLFYCLQLLIVLTVRSQLGLD